MDMKKVITWASLLLKSGLALIFLIITLFLGLAALDISGENKDASGIALLCFGPFALIFGIFFVIIVLWILQELKGEIKEKENGGKK
jgi:hypothetical protein